MYVTIIFWLALFLPGYAITRRCFRDELDSGIVGTIAVSYLLTLGLLSPVSILCYVLRTPVWVFAGFIGIVVVAALVDLSRSKAWGALGRMMRGPAAVGLIVIALDMVAGMLVGGHMLGDARVHLARIRFLVDHGMSNVDPFVRPEYFYPIYHTNLLHALHAACVKLTGVDHFGVWFVSLGWVKLLVTSAAYYLAWSVFRIRLAGWAAALFSIVIWGSVPFMLYPNKVAPLFICAVMLGVVVRMLAEDCTWRRCLLLGVGSLLLGQVHGLYGAFAALAFGLPLGFRSIRAWVNGRRDRNCLIVAVLCLSFAGPFLVATSQNTRPREVAIDADGQPVRAYTATRNFHHFDNGWLMYRVDRPFGNHWWYGLPLLLVAGAIAARRADRAGALALFGVLGTVAALLFVPPLCAGLLRLTEQEWVVSRFGFLFQLGFIALVPGSLAVLVDARVRSMPVRALLLVLIALLALPYGAKRDSLSWTGYARKLATSGERRQMFVGGSRAALGLVRDKLEPGATVLTAPREGVPLVMVADCFIVAAYSSNNGVLDLDQRRADVEVMLDGDARVEHRASLLAQYDVRYFVSTKGESPRWPGDWIKQHWFEKPWLIIEFDRTAIGG